MMDPDIRKGKIWRTNIQYRPQYQWSHIKFLFFVFSPFETLVKFMLNFLMYLNIPYSIFFFFFIAVNHSFGLLIYISIVFSFPLFFLFLFSFFFLFLFSFYSSFFSFSEKFSFIFALQNYYICYFTSFKWKDNRKLQMSKYMYCVRKIYTTFGHEQIRKGCWWILPLSAGEVVEHSGYSRLIRQTGLEF